ncbi:MAG: hypothetical protein DVB22_000176 [Verrucomicrobia bacterium]|nr:MAG: hypothetical protein DVB22_000176 [Verrucomicrobiota bacterium]
MDDTATPTPRLEREMVQEALEGLAELVVRGVRASADPGEAAGKAGAGLRALGAWVERLAGEGSVAGNVRREPMHLRAEVPVETGRMSVGIPSAVGVLDPGDFPEAFVVTKEPEEEAALAEGDSFLMVDGPWGPVVVPEEVAVRVEVAGEGAVVEVPAAAEMLEAAEELEEATVPVVVAEVTAEAAEVETPVAEVAVMVSEPELKVSVPEEKAVEARPEVVAPLVALEPEVKSVAGEVMVVEKTPEVFVPLAVVEPEVKLTVPEEPMEAAMSEVVVPPVVEGTEAKAPIEVGREAVEWRMPETVVVAPPGRGPRVVMRLMLLVLLVVVGWLAYKAVELKG